MKSKITILALGLVLSLAPQAHAQSVGGEKPEAKQLETPTHALEFYGSTAYTQGFGSLESGVDLGGVITPGFATEMGGGYRFDPRWSLGLVGQYAEFNAQRADRARGLLVGAAVTYHALPYDKLDPWLQFGVGYRLLWETNVAPNPSLLTHGFEPARLTVGVDIRASRDIAFAPVVGIDLTLPLWQSVGGGASQALSNPTVSTFVFAGLQARFDLTSRFVGGAPPVAEASVTQATVCPH